MGYSQGSKTPSEFDVTEFVQAGNNQVSIQVYRFSDGSYLEGQDTWRISGLERDVSIYARDKIRIDDFTIKASLNDSYSEGIFSIDIDILNRLKLDRSVSIRAKLSDPMRRNRTIFDSTKITGTDSLSTISIKHKVRRVKKWSAEKPYLYRLQLYLMEDGKLLETFTHQVGFRKIEIKNGKFLINGLSLIHI